MMKYFVTIIAILALLTSCGKDDDKGGGNTYTPGRRTIIVYMAGENNLSSFAQDDINEMIIGSKTMPDDCRLLMFVDRSSNNEKPFIARLNGKNDVPVDTLYKYPQDFYSSDAGNFREVLERCIALCPSQEYGLVLWGHANGWVIEQEHESYTGKRAYGLDNGKNTWELTTVYWMNIPSMARALKDIGVKWNFIFSDCCNMQCVEVAYELKDVADYFIASPAEISGEGAPYSKIIVDLCKADDQEMYKSACDDYNIQFDFVNGHLPISVIKTDKLDILLNATRNILPQVNEYTQSHGTLDGLIYYYSYNKSSIYNRVMFDMNDVVLKALEGQDSLYNVWKGAFDQAVVYKKNSTFWHANSINFSDFRIYSTTENDRRQGVVSMFFPLSHYNTRAYYNYNTLIKQMQWYQAVGWSEVGW